MTQSNASSRTTSDGVELEVAFARVFDAPRRLAFKVWIDPKHVARWWGPHGFTNVRCELDLRAGGAIRIDMRGPRRQGVSAPMTGIYEEIVELKRLVLTSSAFWTKRATPSSKCRTR
jgi:uncharacterized protein YndB with AHSA1/START domain